MATVDLEHVHKTYEGGFEAVRDVNLAIKEREFIVLVGPDVVLGIRPEALAPSATARFAPAGSELAMKMKVWLVQPLGATMDIYLQTDRHERIVAHVDASADGAAPGVGETLAIAVDMERAHFFAPGELGIALA